MAIDLSFMVAGTTFRPKEDIKAVADKLLSTQGLEVVTKKVTLVPEPNNPYDNEAIKVLVFDRHIGYVPKTYPYKKELLNSLVVTGTTKAKPTCKRVGGTADKPNVGFVIDFVR